ncbi:MAG: UDP-N-acetylmuramoyl-L-alanine--D-glutamate ligase [Gammaproteobacteria bacterium]
MNTGAHQANTPCVVIGLGLTGQSCVRYLRAQGLDVLACDSRADAAGAAALRARFPEVEILTGPLEGERLARCARLVVSPGVPLSDPALVAARAAGVEILGDIELFARAARAPLSAVTGTNGKSTVTTLVADILEAAGRSVRRGGNLGTPALDLLDTVEPDDYVLELSSFQLELSMSLAPAVATVLNITPDHLDRHGSMDAYIAAKTRILTHAATAVLNADDPLVAALPVRGRRIEFTLGAPSHDRFGLRSIGESQWLAGPEGDLLAVEELGMSGRHNIANALAAAAMASARGIDYRTIAAVLRGFRGLPHRVEMAGEIAGVRYVNDSKATNPGAAIASMEGLLGTRNGVLIAGGDGKGADFTEFAEVVARRVHTVVLIGRAARVIERALAGRCECVFATDMNAAVQAAHIAARAGDVVLLAPACASLDMFTSYAERGRAFSAAVAALEHA